MSPKSNFLISVLPSSISFFRGFLSFVVLYLIFQPALSLHYLAFFLFGFGSLTDFFDGYFARKFKVVSDFGKILDPLMDKIFILTIMAAFAMLGFYSPWWLVPMFAREIFITFCRTGWYLNGQAIGAEKMGKLKLCFQVATGLAGFLLLFAHDHQHAGHIHTLSLVLHGLIMASLFLTLLSGWQFIVANKALFPTPQFVRFSAAAGVGNLPLAPGTWGSLLGLGLVLLTSWNIFLHAAVLGLMVWGSWASISRLDLSKDQDPSYVVMDEVCGMMLTFLCIPLTWQSALTGFLLFRFLDVIKPYPANAFEKIPGFWGIMLDDLMAGFYAWLALFLIFR